MSENDVDNFFYFHQTWLCSIVQYSATHYDNWGFKLYPEFRSTSEFIETPEKFGFVILCDQELTAAHKNGLSSIPDKAKQKWRLTHVNVYIHRVNRLGQPLYDKLG